jgi:hypothetical protein
LVPRLVPQSQQLQVATLPSEPPSVVQQVQLPVVL